MSAVLLMTGAAYTILAKVLIHHHGENSLLAEAFGNDWKGKISVGIYALAIILSCWNAMFGFWLYVVVACIWFIPDKRIERKITHENH